MRLARRKVLAAAPAATLGAGALIGAALPTPASGCSAPPRRCPGPGGVYNPVPKLVGFEATWTGGDRNGFYGAGEVNAYNAVQ